MSEVVGELSATSTVDFIDKFTTDQIVETNSLF